MTVQVMKYEDAPSWARQSSSFHGEGEVHIVLADSWDDAIGTAGRLCREQALCDYDASWDDIGERWVGVTCK